MEWQHWYAVFVLTGWEDKLKQRIEELVSRSGLQASVLAPKRFLRERKGGKMVEVFKPMFPGYLLVGADDMQGFAELVGSLTGVLTFLKNDDMFLEIRLEEIERLLAMADQDGIIGESAVSLDENDSVVVIAGALEGYEGRITKFNRRKNRVAVDFTLGSDRREVWLSVSLVDGGQGR